MTGRDSRIDLDRYSIWRWIGGVALCALPVRVMLQFPNSIS